MHYMKAQVQRINNLLFGPHRYVIPVFQRYYVWDDANWEQLWDDIEEVCNPEPPSNAFRTHFMGSIVSASGPYQPGMMSSLLVIDGQQRLTTLSLLLCAIRDLARARDDRSRLADQIEDEYLVHKYSKGNERYRLFPRQRDRHVYLALIDAKQDDIRDRSSLLLHAYLYHRKRLEADYNKAEEGTIHSLRRVFEAIVTQLEVVSIVLEKDDNPFQIFSSLNSTGVDLEEGDLIRNHVFMQLEPDRQDCFDEDHWQRLEAVFNLKPAQRTARGESADTKETERQRAQAKDNAKLLTDFFRDELMTSGNYVKATATYEEFEKRYKELAPTRKGESGDDPIESRLIRLANFLTRQARLYQVVRGESPAASVRISHALELIRELRMLSAYPLVLKCLTLYSESTISEDELVANLRAISGFFLRRSVCGESSRSYSQWFCAWSGRLSSDNPTHLPAWLSEQKWPSDEEFIEGFTQFDMYKNRFGKTMLTRLEKESQHPDERVVLDQCQVEHVMPQSIEPNTDDGKAWMQSLGGDWERVWNKWLHTPGNLTLVGADYNNEMRNRSYSAKVEVLTKSAVTLNSYFKGIDEWNEDTIKARARLLGELATHIWSGPTSDKAKQPKRKRGKAN
jgi:hypothetical protein